MVLFLFDVTSCSMAVRAFGTGMSDECDSQFRLAAWTSVNEGAVGALEAVHSAFCFNTIAHVTFARQLHSQTSRVAVLVTRPPAKHKVDMLEVSIDADNLCWLMTPMVFHIFHDIKQQQDLLWFE